MPDETGLISCSPLPVIQTTPDMPREFSQYPDRLDVMGIVSRILNPSSGTMGTVKPPSKDGTKLGDADPYPRNRRAKDRHDAGSYARGSRTFGLDSIDFAEVCWTYRIKNVPAA